jgi:hypothetical protein
VAILWSATRWRLRLRRRRDELAPVLREHLPDYEPAVQRMPARATRKLIIVFYPPPRRFRFRRKRDERFERGFYTHTHDLGRFVDHLLNGLSPPATEVRIHPRQGTSDPRFRWGDRENIVYEILR